MLFRSTFVTYSRVFDPKVTKEVRLYGFNGADNFMVDEKAKSSVRLRIIGGRGEDTFNIRGRVRTHLYDLSYEKNEMLATRRVRDHRTDEPDVNQFKIQDFNYNEVRFPWVNLGFNPEDGIFVGAGYWRKSYGFRKDPLKTEHKLSTLYAPLRSAYQIRYQGTFVGLIGNKYDLLLHGWMQNPALQNFFGYGNETKRETMSNRQYRTRYNFVTLEGFLQKRLFGKLRLGVGPSLYYYSNHRKDNEGRILEEPEKLGLDSNRLFSRKYYAGGKAYVHINNLNSELFPTRGIDWRTELTAYGGVRNESRPFTGLRSDMNVYASLRDPARLVAVLRLGGGHIFSKDFEYFQAMGVGQNNYLRGFRKNRFSGRSMAYGSIELRAKIANVSSFILPGTFGVLGFDDVGRVWMDGEHSRQWHNSIGGGFYYIPYNLIIISATAAYSREQVLFGLTVGTKLNVTF